MVERGSVTPSTLKVGVEEEMKVAIRNLTREPFEVSSVQRDCSCVGTRDLPFTVPAGRSETFGIVWTPQKAGDRVEQFLSFTVVGEKVETASVKLSAEVVGRE